MRILVTTDTLSGVWTYTRELVTGLVSRGATVTLVSFGDILALGQIAWMDNLHGLEYRPTAFRLDWMQEGQFDFAESSAYLVDLIKERKPDMLHLNHPCYGALAVGTPRIVVAHGDFINWWKAVHGREPKPTQWLRWYRERLNQGLAEADAVVAPTVWMLDSMRSSYKSTKRNQVIYHGRNPVLFNPYGKKDDSVLAVGRLLDPSAQLSLLTQRTYSLPISIVASNATGQTSRLPIRADVRVAIDEDAVSFKGLQTEAQMRALYSRSATYISTSRYQPFGISAVEAAFSRCAIVANDIAAHREIWGDAALYFRSTDPSSLADTLGRLGNDAELRRNYANRSFRRAHDCFTAARMMDEYVSLYDRVLRNQPSVLAA